MHRARMLALAMALALPSLARADVTVIYAPSAPQRAPLVARPVEPQRAPLIARPVEPQRAPLVARPVEGARGPASASAPAPAVAPSGPAASVPSRVCPAPVELVRALEGATERRSLVLLGCDRRPDPESLTALSILARPHSISAPRREVVRAHVGDPEWVAPSIRRLHPGLLERLRAIADRFPGHAIEIVAGERPDAPEGSRHLHGLALDLRVAGASLDTVHAFVSRFDRTGVGLYPAAGFIHLDVRRGVTRWTDASRPGEPPRPVRTDAPPRGGRIREAPPPTELRPAPPPATPSDGEHDVDPDAIADEIARALSEIPIPVPPPRSR